LRNTEAGMDFRADDGYDSSDPSVGIFSDIGLFALNYTAGSKVELYNR
jgi:hypothetical protein